jgi:hypothetical protein
VEPQKEQLSRTCIAPLQESQSRNTAISYLSRNPFTIRLSLPPVLLDVPVGSQLIVLDSTARLLLPQSSYTISTPYNISRIWITHTYPFFTGRHKQFMFRLGDITGQQLIAVVGAGVCPNGIRSACFRRAMTPLTGDRGRRQHTGTLRTTNL